MRVVAAPDKFRGTVTAPEIAAAIEVVASSSGWESDAVPLADGGEGMLAVFGGVNRSALVSGPLGDPVEAGWRLQGRTAYVEMALASGLVLAGGAEGNDPLAASTYGTGELIDAALDRGAKRVVVGVGGSATTDGGLGALRVLYPVQRVKGVELIVACDVTTRFVDAAEVFGPQKGATPKQVELLRRRLERLLQVYESDYGVDISELDGAGAAGGLAGGLAAIGAELQPGFELIADEVGLADHIAGADLVVTGEGALDAQSFSGKVVGGVCELAAEVGVPVLIVAGTADVDPPTGARLVSLTERFGADRSQADAAGAVTEVVREVLIAGGVARWAG